jgi:hypothetical protein
MVSTCAQPLPCLINNEGLFMLLGNMLFSPFCLPLPLMFRGQGLKQ